MPGEQPDFYALFAKIGGLEKGIENINALLSEMKGEQVARHAENSRNISDTLTKLKEFKHQQGNHDQKVEFRLAKIESSAGELKAEVKSLRKPVDQIVAIRSKIGVLLAACLSIGGVIWVFVSPVWSFFYTRVIASFFDGGHH